MTEELAYETEAAASPGNKKAGPDVVTVMMSKLLQLGLVIAGGWFLWLAIEMTPRMTTSIHEIYQLVASLGGLTLWALAGIWGAIDAVRAAVDR